MNFKQLEAFYWLTQLRNYNRVANALGLTQPAVSARISSLEDNLGVQLIDRSSAEFRLTDRGQQVAEYAEAFITLRDAMTDDISAPHPQHLSIGIVGTVASTWAPHFAKAVRDARQNCHIEFQVFSTADLSQKLRQGSIDLAFLMKGANVPWICDDFTLSYRMGWVARPEIANQIKGQISAKEFRHLPIISFSHKTGFRDSISELHPTFAPHHPLFTAYALSTVRDLVREGLGAAALPLAVIADDLKRGDLKEIEVQENLEDCEIVGSYIDTSKKQIHTDLLDLARQSAEAWAKGQNNYVSFTSS